MKVFILIFIGALLVGCEAMDTILPSAGNYRVNMQINENSLDSVSFIRSDDDLRPYFEESISEDRDVTALLVFLRDSMGEPVGRRVFYSLIPEDSKDMVVYVNSLDGSLPAFPIPNNLPMGRYTLTFQVMSGKNILQKNERSVFFLGRNNFSFESINVNMPGVTDTPLLIPRDTKIMLEAVLNFDYRLNPYIVWYDGKRKISEGKFSDGAGNLFWQAPEQSGFFSLRAEVFPIEDFKDLTGYQKEVSLLVSSKTKDFNLISEDIPQLIHWYTFEGNLSDSKMIFSQERYLKPAVKSNPVWMGANGTYGLVTGQNISYSLPVVLIPESGANVWQTLFRFKYLDDGVIFSVLFNQAGNVSLSFIKEGSNFILLLKSPTETVSQVYSLPVSNINSSSEQAENDPFITVGINFSILQNTLSAQLNLMGEIIEGELTTKPISIRAAVNEEFRILLGSLENNNESADELAEKLFELKKVYTAIWDEFALYHMPPMEALIAKLRLMGDEL